MEKLVTIQEAIRHLKDGNTLLYPTDTLWGLGCDATNSAAIRKLHTLKNRPAEKSFILLVDSVVMLERYVKEIPEVCYDLIDLTEKPLTIIYESPVFLPEELLAADGSIGIRVTKDSNCKKLIQGLRKPIVSTSANISGAPNANSFSEIAPAIKEQVDVILNDRLHEKMKKPSSIIKVANNGTVQVIR